MYVCSRQTSVQNKLYWFKVSLEIVSLSRLWIQISRFFSNIACRAPGVVALLLHIGVAVATVTVGFASEFSSGYHSNHGTGPGCTACPRMDASPGWSRLRVAT